MREGEWTVNVDALLASGANADGYRKILGFAEIASAKDGAKWLASSVT